MASFASHDTLKAEDALGVRDRDKSGIAILWEPFSRNIPEERG